MEKASKVFVYGTLVSEHTRERLGVEAREIKEGILKNYQKQGLNVIPKRGTSVPGLLFSVSEGDLKKLDEYEGYPSFYTRDELPIKVGNKTEKAFTYHLGERGNGHNVVAPFSE
jgi:gamma-glutamylcyclotransferase (GGCT)/AIG2-like uncharacterized protein YtfP